MNKKAIWIIIVIIIIIVGVVAFGSDRGGSQSGPIELGFIGPLSGDAAQLGTNARRAAELAVAEANEDGGINGREITLSVQDGQCTGSAASRAANKLINVNDVAGIIGGLCSAETSAFVDLLDSSKTPAVSYGSSAPKLSDAGPYFFRTYPSDSREAVFAADYIKNEMDIDKAAVMYTKDDFGQGLAEAFRSAFKDAEGTITTVESFKKSSRDLRTQIAKVQESDPELIYFIGFTQATVPGVRQIREAGLDVPLFGASSWSDTTIWEELGSTGEGARVVTLDVNESEEFAQKLKERGAESVTLGSTNAYDATRILLEAIEEVGMDGTKISEYLTKTTFDDTVTSDVIEFDQNGDIVTAEYVVNEVRDAELEPISE